MILVVLEDASGGEEHVVDAQHLTHIRHDKSADDVGADGLDAVVLAPVHVGAAGHTRGVEDVGRLILLDLAHKGLAIVCAALSVLEGLALLSQKLTELSADPTGAAKYEVAITRHVLKLRRWFLKSK